MAATIHHSQYFKPFLEENIKYDVEKLEALLNIPSERWDDYMKSTLGGVEMYEWEQIRGQLDKEVSSYDLDKIKDKLDLDRSLRLYLNRMKEIKPKHES